MKYRGCEDNTLREVAFNNHEDLSLGILGINIKNNNNNNKTASHICVFIAVQDEDDRQLTDRQISELGKLWVLWQSLPQNIRWRVAEEDTIFTSNLHIWRLRKELS